MRWLGADAGGRSHPSFLYDALRSAVALQLSRRILALLLKGMSVLLCVLLSICGFRGGVLAPHLAEAAAMWQPPAAKEGQGDCDFPLGPPWILLYPLKRRRSARGMEAAERRVLTRRSAAGVRGERVALRSFVDLRFHGGVLAPHLAAIAAVWLPPAAKEGQGDCEFPLLPPWILFSPLCTAAAPLRGWRRQGIAFWCKALPLLQR